MQHNINSAQYLPESLREGKLWRILSMNHWWTSNRICVYFLGFLLLLFRIKLSPPLNEITIQTRVDGLFVQILPLNFRVAAKKRAQMVSLREQRCIENLEVGWLFLPGLMSHFVFLFTYELFTFSSKCQHWCRAAAGRNELTCSSTHTLYFFHRTHTKLMTEKLHMCMHTLQQGFVYPARSRPACTLVLLFPHLMCEKWKEIKVISFTLAGVGCGSLGQEGRHWL